VDDIEKIILTSFETIPAAETLIEHLIHNDHAEKLMNE
jgi:hypothetical protein